MFGGPGAHRPAQQQTRIISVIAWVSNIWLVILWTRAIEAERNAAASDLIGGDLPATLLAGALVGIGISVFSLHTEVNPAPHHPSARDPGTGEGGQPAQVHPPPSRVSGSLSLIVCFFGAALLGQQPVLFATVVAALLLLKGLIARRSEAIALLLLGACAAGPALIPNADLRFLWPVWLVMTHTLVAGGLMRTLMRSRARLDLPRFLAGGIGWAGVTLLLAALSIARTGTLWPGWVQEEAGILAGAMAVGFVAFALLRSRKPESRARNEEKVARYSALWPVFYAPMWTLGQGLRDETFILAGLAVFALISMMILRELFGLIEEPVGYRR